MTSAEIDALVVALQAGFETPSKLRAAIARELPESLPKTARLTLRSLAQRAEARQLDEDDERSREVYADAGLVMDSTTGAWVRRR